MPTPAQQLAREIATLRREVERISRASQMSRRSLEGGGLKIYDLEGVYRGTVGVQPDGSNAYVSANDPQPPTPSAPDLTPTHGGVEVTVFCTFESGARRPAGVKHFEVHASTMSGFTPTEHTLRATTEEPETILLSLPPVTWHFRIVAVTYGGTASAPSIVATETALSAPSQAEVDAATRDSEAALTAANGKNTVHWSLSPAPTPPAGDEIEGDVWFRRDADDNIIGQWEFTSGAWASRQIADEAIAALNVGKLVGGTIAAGEYVSAGDTSSYHAKMESDGFRVYSLTKDGNVEEAGSFGTGSDGLTLKDPDTGDSTVSLTPSGLTVPAASVGGTDTDGDGVPDSGFDIYGRDFLDWISDTSGGPTAAATYYPTGGAVVSGVTSATGVGELAFSAKAGRAYHISLDGLQLASSDGWMRALVALRATEDGSTPTVSNGVTYASNFVHLANTNQAEGMPPFSFVKSWDTDTEVRMLLFVQRWNGGVSTSTLAVRTYEPSNSYFAPLRWHVVEVGRLVADNFQTNDGGGSGGGGAPADPKKTYTTTWVQNWGASYLGDGSKRTDTTDLMQGYTSYYSAGGNQRGLSNFAGGADYSTSSGEVGKTIVQALSGATVEKVEVKLHCNHSHSYSGGTAEIGYHGELTEPSTAPAGAYGSITKFFHRGDTLWIPLPSSTYDDWKNGSYRGITVGPTGDYMRFDGAGTDKPAIRITYTR